MELQMNNVNDKGTHNKMTRHTKGSSNNESTKNIKLEINYHHTRKRNIKQKKKKYRPSTKDKHELSIKKQQ